MNFHYGISLMKCFVPTAKYQPILQAPASEVSGIYKIIEGKFMKSKGSLRHPLPLMTLFDEENAVMLVGRCR